MSSQSTIIKSESIIGAELSGGSVSMSKVTSVWLTIPGFSISNADELTYGHSKTVGDFNIGARLFGRSVFMSSLTSVWLTIPYLTSSVPMIANMTVRSTTVMSEWDTLVYPSHPSVSLAKLQCVPPTLGSPGRATRPFCMASGWLAQISHDQ